MRALILCLLLAGCASAPVIQPVTICLPMRDYSTDDQKALGAAVAQLEATNPIVSALLDYEAMRAADRACVLSDHKGS